MGDLSRNFNLGEFDCNDGTPVPKILIPNARMLCSLILQPIRDEVGHPVIITSGFRTKKHNKKCKGEPDSFHLYLLAADTFCPALSVEEYYQKIVLLRSRGIIPPCAVRMYPEPGKRFVHTDLGPFREW